MLELEDTVLETATGVVEAALAFHEVTFDQKDPPPEWIERYGEQAARQRLQVAKSGWLPGSMAPAGVKLSVQVMTGIHRARGQRVQVKAGQINVQLTLPAPTSAQHPGAAAYPEKDVE